jgi:SAM-dependent methyltransferase
VAYDVYGIRFLLHAADLGVDYSSTATLGHLFLFADEVDLAEAFAACRGETSPEVATGVYRDCAGYVDGVLRYLGADHVDSVDASEYEGATVVHDFNVPIPPELEGRYSAVVDGGTLEHVFDFPAAMRNAMKLVRQGGHLILHIPVNNFPGHGFYQISPELLFRVLSPRFGFRIRDAVMIEMYHPRPRWFRVADPAAVGHRVMFRSHARTVMYVLAERVGPVAEFSPPPTQSDYATEWERLDAPDSQPAGSELTPVAHTSAPSTAGAPVGAPTSTMVDRAVGLARRSIPSPVLGTIERARRTVPVRIGQTRRFRELKRWMVWAVPRLGLHPHYSRVRPAFEPVDEPWTASARRLRPPVRREADAPPPLFGQP